MARLPVPGQELSSARAARDASSQPPRPRVPETVIVVGRTLRAAGHEACLVGGCVRDLLRGVEPADWDVATDARPDRLLQLFPGARYENRFGTVAVPIADRIVEVTTYRRDGTYSDHRRPDDVTFGDSLAEDLARRDFTVNALALVLDADGRPGTLVDLADGQADLAARVLRAVGDPPTRFREDALRMLRAVRFAAALEFAIEPATRAAITAEAGLARHVSGERTLAELFRLLAAPRPSVGLREAQATGLLAELAPELAAQVGMPQAKVTGEDLWDHTCRTVDAARMPESGARPVARMAALLHDVGKPATFADGHFVGHEVAGAEMAAAWLEGLHAPAALTEAVRHLVRHHMFAYEPVWTDSAVRRFIRRVGAKAIDDLLDLREADNLGSGQPADVDGLEELRARVHAQLASRVALERGDLAVDGADLVEQLGIAPGPEIGRILERLVDRVVDEPRLNRRATLLGIAGRLAATGAPQDAPVAGSQPPGDGGDVA